MPCQHPAGKIVRADAFRLQQSHNGKQIARDSQAMEWLQSAFVLSSELGFSWECDKYQQS